MFLVSSCRCICSIHWRQVLSWEWRCSWSNADRRCSNYKWVNKKCMAYKGTTYIKVLTVYYGYIRSNDMWVINNIIVYEAALGFVGTLRFTRTTSASTEGTSCPFWQVLSFYCKGTYILDYWHLSVYQRRARCPQQTRLWYSDNGMRRSDCKMHGLVLLMSVMLTREIRFSLPKTPMIIIVTP